MLLNMVRPYRIAFLMDAKLSSRMVISPASLATSVPLPMAKPTSAFFSAGESLTPSPVIPTTSSSSCASLTRRLLSVGKALETTRRCGRMAFISSSLFSAISADVSATSSGSASSPASFAMAHAVSFRSPVTMTTWIPARCTSRMASLASIRTLSRILMMHTRVKSPSSESPFRFATASRRMERPACSFI